MVEHIDPTKTTTGTNECPCVTILHITQKLIKNNKVASGGKLANRDEVHGEFRDIGNIENVKVDGVQSVTASNGQGCAISNDDKQVTGNKPT